MNVSKGRIFSETRGRVSMKSYSLLLCLTVMALAGMLHGQGGAVGTILGTVTDSQGAVVANAEVDVTNLATSVTQKAHTTDTGDFTVPYLTPEIIGLACSRRAFRSRSSIM